MSSTSPRPITDSEAVHADGEPTSTFMTFFGMTQGIILHMNYYKLNYKSVNWFPNAQAKLFGVLFIGGGLITGRAIGQFLFCTPELQRLKRSHELDNQTKTYMQTTAAP